MAATIMILYVSKLNKIINFPDFDKKIPIKVSDEKYLERPKIIRREMRDRPAAALPLPHQPDSALPLSVCNCTSAFSQNYSVEKDLLAFLSHSNCKK